MELPCSTCRPESDTRRSSEEDVLYSYRERIHYIVYMYYYYYIIVSEASKVKQTTRQSNTAHPCTIMCRSNFFADFNFYRMHGV